MMLPCTKLGSLNADLTPPKLDILIILIRPCLKTSHAGSYFDADTFSDQFRGKLSEQKHYLSAMAPET